MKVPSPGLHQVRLLLQPRRVSEQPQQADRNLPGRRQHRQRQQVPLRGRERRLRRGQPRPGGRGGGGGGPGQRLHLRPVGTPGRSSARPRSSRVAGAAGT